MLDGKKINSEDGDSASQIRSLSEVKGISSALQSEDTVMDNNEFRESCSCLEGNPCVDKYNCKDWANREKIAKEVRKKKGMSDVFVTGGLRHAFRVPFISHKEYPEKNAIRIIDLINNESS